MLVFLVTLARPIGAQSDNYTFAPDVRIYSVEQDSTFHPLWEYVARCSRAPLVPGGDYADIHWFAVSAHGMMDASGRPVVGSWWPPDTIVIDSLWIEASWVIGHEMLHHRLRGPPPPTGPHPLDPFMFPCMLMDFQNVPGGVMGSRRP